MTETEIGAILGRLDTLRVELADLAFLLDTRGRADAADVATITAVRIGELCDEFRSDENPLVA